MLFRKKKIHSSKKKLQQKVLEEVQQILIEAGYPGIEITTSTEINEGSLYKSLVGFEVTDSEKYSEEELKNLPVIITGAFKSALEKHGMELDSVMGLSMKGE